jgi:hypothetical protein
MTIGGRGAVAGQTTFSPGRHRDAVTERIKAGEPFGAVEDSIDAVADLTMDEKAALWLFAFSLRDPAEQQLDARAHLSSLQSRGRRDDRRRGSES